MLYSASSIVRAKVRYNNRSDVINAYRIATEYRDTLDGVVSIITEQRSVAWGFDHLGRTKIKVETLTTGHFIEVHCGEHCVDWEGLIPTLYITRYPAAATVYFNKVYCSNFE